MSFGPEDSGVLDFKTEEETIEYLEGLGPQFKYGCHRERNPIQCHSLGRWYASFKRNFAESENIYRQNCFSRRFADSCIKYASYKLLGVEGVKRNDSQAFEAFKFGCHVCEDARCCQAAGELLVEGAVAEKPTVSSIIDYFLRSCNMNLPNGCFYLGAMYHKQAIEKRENTIDTAGSANDPSYASKAALQKSAVLAWVKACEGGHELACRNVARAYRLGEGVEKDEEVAASYSLEANVSSK
ncbi:unnamed protein product [Mesocestoides corti]|uniref:HcpA family protein n=1 Tax=Mesocestoides corti TaxID=53468 RepID=A0A0R3UIZ2_MESCO|nr:unnamed protein product [Mesocestoides corti]